MKNNVVGRDKFMENIFFFYFTTYRYVFSLIEINCNLILYKLQCRWNDIIIIHINTFIRVFIEDYIDDNKFNEWTPEIPFENVSVRVVYGRLEIVAIKNVLSFFFFFLAEH